METLEDKEGQVIAVLVMEVDAEEMLNPILHTGDGLGKTGEALLVNEDVRIVASLKYLLADGTRARPLDYQIKSAPALLAAEGQEGIIESEDYRGEPVLAAYRYIPVTPEWGWGLVVKRDRAELFAPMREATADSVLVGLVGILAVIGLTVLMARNLTRPILALSQTAKLVSDGDLTARAAVAGSDEVGALAMTFNSMVERVQNWRGELEENVKLRTAELATANEGLKTEVAERKRAEAQIQRLSHRNKLVLDSAGEGIYGLDLRGNTTFVNPAAARMLGWQVEELIGQPQHDVLHHTKPDGTPYPREECPIYASFKDGAVHQVDSEVFWRKDGSSFPVEYVSTPIREDGKPVGAVVVFRDITERKVAGQERDRLITLITLSNEELENLNVQLERSNGELQDFAYVASHDLQEPLRKVQSFGERLKIKYEGELDDQGTDYISRMQNAAERMQQLINDLLSFSRVSSKAQPFTNIELGKVAEGVLSDLETRIDELGARVEISDLPTIDADPLQMRQLLQNLIGNALKFHRDDKPPIVKVRGELLDHKGQQSGELASGQPLCQITVEDNGIGFEEKHAERIFGFFQRLHGRNSYDGTGIGLAICRKIVDRHRGLIIAESSPGQGAKFTVTLPIQQPEGEPAQCQTSDSQLRS